MKPTVYCITATKNRHTQLERVVRFFLNQTYEGRMVHLIYNNAPSVLRLNKNLPPDKFLLINNHLHLGTGKPYTTLGDIYNDILKFLPPDAEIITFMDDDDIYLPEHIEEGIKGLERGGLLSYKPQKSWYKHGKAEATLVENTLEPSIFVKASHIREYGFSPETKTSGNPKDLNNFSAYSHYSTDHGDGIITPCSDSWAKRYYRYAESK